MGHRKSSGRNSVYSSQGRRVTSIGVGASPSSPLHRPLLHLSPVRLPSRPLRKNLWGNGGGGHINNNANTDRPSLGGPNETFTWNEDFGNGSKSPNSLIIGSDGGRSMSSDGGSINSTYSGNSKYSNSGNSKYSNSGSSKKAVARPSNPLRYKTELCRSFEESGDCRFGTACTFAHGLRELRAVLRHPRYKTDLCRTYHGSGYCQYGARCHFIHDPEETAGVAAMRGYQLRYHVNTSSFPMPENYDLYDLNADGLILANLQCLHAYKAAEEKFRFLNSSGSGNGQLNYIKTASPESLCDHTSLNMLKFAPKSFSSLSELRSQGNFMETTDDSESISMNYLNMKTPANGGSKVLSKKSLGGNWLDNDAELATMYYVPNLDVLPCSSRGDTWRGGISSQNKAVIENPMEVSRSMLIPSITDLFHMP